MKIEFTAADARIDEFNKQVKAKLHDQASACLSADGARLARWRVVLGTNSPTRRLFSKWHGFVGPSEREQESTRQRIEALERADLVAANLHEAVAGASQATRERGALREALNRLLTAKSPDNSLQ